MVIALVMLVLCFHALCTSARTYFQSATVAIIVVFVSLVLFSSVLRLLFCFFFFRLFLYTILFILLSFSSLSSSAHFWVTASFVNPGPVRIHSCVTCRAIVTKHHIQTAAVKHGGTKRSLPRIVFTCSSFSFSSSFLPQLYHLQEGMDGAWRLHALNGTGMEPYVGDGTPKANAWYAVWRNSLRIAAAVVHELGQREHCLDAAFEFASVHIEPIQAALHR